MGVAIISVLQTYATMGTWKFCFTKYVNKFLGYLRNWYWFLDDFYIVLDVTIVNLSKYFEALNCIHKDIKFTMEQHDLHLLFLEILLKKNPETSKVWMEIFYKRTDTRRWVYLKRCHSKHCQINIPFINIPYYYGANCLREYGNNAQCLKFSGDRVKYSDSESLCFHMQSAIHPINLP